MSWILDTEILQIYSHSHKCTHRKLKTLVWVAVVREGQCSTSMGRYVSAWPEAIQFEECVIIIALPFLVLDTLGGGGWEGGREGSGGAS